MSWPRRAAGRPWIYGHRGMRDAVAENTIHAFEAALRQGADGVEFDVRINREAEVVVFHDESLDRMTEGEDVRRVADLSLAELRGVRLRERGAIPSLEEVLDWASARRAYLNIELKQDEGAGELLVSAVLRALNRGDRTELKQRVILSSFSPEILTWLVGYGAELPLARLLDPHDRDQEVCLPSGVDGLHPHFTQPNRGNPRQGAQAACFVNAWTVNDTATALRLDALGIDGIITDQPRAIRWLFDERLGVE